MKKYREQIIVSDIESDGRQSKFLIFCHHLYPYYIRRSSLSSYICTVASQASQKKKSPSPSPVNLGKPLSQGDQEYYQNLDFKTLNHENNDENQRFSLNFSQIFRKFERNFYSLCLNVKMRIESNALAQKVPIKLIYEVLIFNDKRFA